MAVLSRVGPARRSPLEVLGASLLVAALMGPAVCAAAAGVGERAPAFSLPDAHGRTVALADDTGRVVIVDFWASWCLPCAPMLPALDALARKYQGALHVLAIDVDRSRPKAEEFLREHLPAPSPWTTILEDAPGEVLSRYGAAGMPAAFVIDAGGIVRVTADGYSEEHMRQLEEAVSAVVPAGATTAAGATMPSPAATAPARR